MQFSSTQKRSLAWLGLGLALLLLIHWLGPVLMPFVVATGLAYALVPVVDRLAARMPRLLAVVLLESLLLLSLLLVLLLMVPILAKEIPLMREQVPWLAERLNQWLQPLLAGWGWKFALDVPSIKAFVLKYLSANFEDAMGSLLASLKLGGSVALTLIGNAVLIPVALFYLLMDWPRLAPRCLELVPPRWRPTFDSVTDEADQVLGQYLRGQLLVMLILALYYSLSLMLFGLDLAWPIGLFTGLAMLVPYLGFGTGLLLALLAGLLQFASLKALVMVAVVYGLGQLIESFFLTPRLVGERIGLHPLGVIFALLAFGQLLGFIGVLIALPATAVLWVAVRRLRSSYLASPLYRG